DKDYRVFGIPRFILIDKDGRFINAEAMRPSYEGIAEYLEELLDPKPYNKDALLEKVYQRMKMDTIKTADQYYKMIYPMIDMTVFNREYAERLKADVMLSLMDMMMTDDPKPYLDNYLNNCGADSLRKKVLSRYDEYLKTNSHLFKGQPAPDFTFTDKKGKLIRLSDLKGKLLFIDVWGTWCAPCIEEIPFIAKLQEKYRNNPNVMIMSIACDKESARPKWLAFLKKHKEMNWAQYQVTTEGNKILDDVYHVMGIPRFMIIDKDGIIIDADAPRPSFDTFNAFFDNIVNKL
ncbi:MAG: TlpA family protein disulfide reductase, partial [Prevotella sp.]|nr:TlpA family protein disulfide reductase [Prevotella sp.]